MEQPRTGLAAGSVGLTEVVFQSVAAMGPAATLVSSLPLVMAFAGGAAVSACLLALIGLSFVAFSVSQLAKQIPSAGSFATYASRSIHPGVGFVVGWLYLLLTLTVSPLLLLILASIMAAVTGAPSLWWLWLVGTLIAVTYVSVRGVGGYGWLVHSLPSPTLVSGAFGPLRSSIFSWAQLRCLYSHFYRLRL